MTTPRRLARRFPLTTFFVLAFALPWALLPLAHLSVVVGLVALLGPTAAAVLTAAWIGGTELEDLRHRLTRWRIPLRWYAAALLLPVPISALASVIEQLFGAPGPIRFQPVSMLGAVVFVMVAGEEIGWRGFALPHLLRRSGPWAASITLGTLWGLWHLPLFYLAGMPQFGHPFLPYVGCTIALSIIVTVLAGKTQGSVIIATLFHGAVNTFVVVNAGATVAQRGWGDAASYGLVALLLGAAAWNRRAAGAMATPPLSVP